MDFKLTLNDFLTLMMLGIFKSIIGFLTSMVIPIFPSLIAEYFATLNSSSIKSQNINSSNNHTINQKQPYGYIELSLLYSCKNLCQLLLCPIIGFLIEKLGARYIILTGALFQLTSLLLYGLARNYRELLMGRIMEGSGSVSINTAISALIAYKLTEHKKRGLFFGVGGLSLSIGTALGPAFGGWCFEFYGKTKAFLSISSFLVVGIFLILALIHIDKSWRCSFIQERSTKFIEIEVLEPILELKESIENGSRTLNSINEQNHNPPITSKSPNDILAVFRLLFDPYFLICLGMFPAMFMTLFVFFSTLPRYMHLQFGATESQQGVVWLLCLLGYFLGFAIGHSVNCHLAKQRHIALMFMGLSHSVGLMFTALVPVWWAVSIPLCILVAQHMIAEMVVAPIMVNIVETRHGGRFGYMSSIIMMNVAISAGLGSFLGPLLFRTIGMLRLNLILFVANVAYTPLFIYLRPFI